MSRSPKIYCVYGVRYEPDFLVREFRQNMSWVDELVEVNDRSRTGELWVDESKYRMMQRAALEDAGIEPGSWVIVSSPDERWGRGAETAIRRFAAKGGRRIGVFPLREMFTPTKYRTDGMWGNKTRPRLYPYLPGQRFTQKTIQTPPTPVEGGYRYIHLDVPIYHLENIAPASRIERAIVYEALSPGSQRRAARSAYWREHDPSGRYIRAYGFAYLADTRGMRLMPVPSGDITPPPVRPYIFRVPDELLVAECGRNRAQLTRWLRRTLAGGPLGPQRRGARITARR